MGIKAAGDGSWVVTKEVVMFPAKLGSVLVAMRQEMDSREVGRPTRPAARTPRSSRKRASRGTAKS